MPKIAVSFRLVLRVRERVGDVDRPAFDRSTTLERSTSKLVRMGRLIGAKLRRLAGAGHEPQSVPLAQGDRALVGAAKPNCRIDQRSEDWLQVEGRAADDLEHIGGCGLLLQRFGELGGARLHFFEQTNVFDGDHRLIGEGLDKLDLFVAERAHFIAANHKHADCLVLPQQRDGEKGAGAKPTGNCPACGKLAVGSHVMHVDRFPIQHDAAGHHLPHDRQISVVNRDCPVMRHNGQHITASQHDICITSTAEPSGALSHGVQDRLNIGG